MDEYRTRPGDEYVEPLFAGLGVESDQESGPAQEAPPEAHGAPPRSRDGRTALQWVLGLAALGALLAWALL